MLLKGAVGAWTEMADPQILRLLPEIGVLAEIAREHKADFRLHGSVARALLQAVEQQSSVPSIFDLVPPLSDIDIVVDADVDVSRFERPSPAEIRAEILRQLPVGRFFHWEVRGQNELASYRKYAHVRVENQPYVLFLGSETPRAEPWARRAVVSINADGHIEIDLSLSASTTRIKWLHEASRLGDSDINGALRDILFLARAFPSEVVMQEPPRRLQQRLSEAGGKGVARALRGAPAEWQRTLFALLKYLLARSAAASDAQPPDLRSFLGEPFWDDLQLELQDPVARKLVSMMLLPKVPPFKAVILPKPLKKRWVRRICHVQESDSEKDGANKRSFLEKWGKLLKIEKADLEILEAQGQTSGMFLSPVARIGVDDPPDPSCCIYRDFSRGIAEIAWVESFPPTCPIRPLNALVVMPDLQDLYFAHSYLTAGRASSLRLDYGFLSILGSRRRALEVLGLGAIA
jgi:hypothetical protein